MTEQIQNLHLNCLVCSNDMETSFLPCNCLICLDCTFEWIKIQNLETLYINENFLTCPNFGCKIKLEMDWLYSNMTSNHFEQLNNIFLKKYLNSDTIKKCPKNGCEYSGFMEKNQKCEAPFICEICETTWKDQNHSGNENENDCHINENIFYFYLQKILFFLRIYKNFIQEEISEIRISVLYKSCVHCDRVINKFIGCDHITCVCKREFCYNCLKDYTVHLNEIAKCQKSKNLKSLFIFLIFIKFLFKTIFSFNIFITILKYVFWILWLEIFGIGFICLTGLVLAGWVTSLYSKNWFFGKILFKIISGLFIIAGFYFINIAYNKFEFFRISVKTVFIEGVMAFVSFALFKIGKWRRNLIRRVD